MRSHVRDRVRAQVFAIAAAVMLAMVGGVAMVVDVGMFLIVQRQFQAAADAGALAGAWYANVCVINDVGCKNDRTATDVAREVALANAQSMLGLCGGVIPDPIVNEGTRRNLPARTNAIVVTVKCDAGYSFGRILNLDTAHISASGAAVIGKHGLNGELESMPTGPADCAPHSPPPTPPTPPVPGQATCLIARLVE
jgi:hypothetical protein